MDGILLDDGWDDWDSLWDVDHTRFPEGFKSLLAHASRWGTRLGVWMSPAGGYNKAGGRRVAFGRKHGYETSPRGGFALAGKRYFASFRDVVQHRLVEGFGLFKFDGIGGGLRQSGGDSYMADFEAMLYLIRDMRRSSEAQARPQPWVSLTIGTWPSPFWLLWADSIWRDGPDVGLQGEGSPRERWLTFRDVALRQALRRGPLFPMAAFMQHGICWTRSAEANDIWSSTRADRSEDFANEVLTFFLSGTGLQELYVQLELMHGQLWAMLAEAASLARSRAALLEDAHPVGGDPLKGENYGVAALLQPQGHNPPRGLMWWRNPAAKGQRKSTFNLAEVLELPEILLEVGWCLAFRPLRLRSAPAALGELRAGLSSTATPCHCKELDFWMDGVPDQDQLWLRPRDALTISISPFAVHAWELQGAFCPFEW